MGTISAFKAAGFPLLSVLAYVISFLGLAPSFLTLFAAAPRMLFSLAKAGLLPAFVGRVNPKHGTPTNALWIVLVLILGLGWRGKGALVYFLDIGGFLIGLTWAFNALALLKIRHQQPTLVGTFRNRYLSLPTLGGCIALMVALATVIPNTPVSLVWPYEYIVLGIWCLFGIGDYLTNRVTAANTVITAKQFTPTLKSKGASK